MPWVVGAPDYDFMDDPLGARYVFEFNEYKLNDFRGKDWGHICEKTGELVWTLWFDNCFSVGESTKSIHFEGLCYIPDKELR